jgi:hypothetical protein
MGIKVYSGNLLDEGSYARHNPDKLNQIFLQIIKETKNNKIAVNG